MSSKKITKNDLINFVYAVTGFDRLAVRSICEALLASIKDALKKGSVIELRGFGTFEPRLRKGRPHARNPRTGEAVSVEPHYVVVFRGGKDLKASVRNLKQDNQVASDAAAASSESNGD